MFNLTIDRPLLHDVEGNFVVGFKMPPALPTVERKKAKSLSTFPWVCGAIMWCESRTLHKNSIIATRCGKGETQYWGIIGFTVPPVTYIMYIHVVLKRYSKNSEEL